MSAAVDRELMLQFCSLGRNCEFGLVQRGFGAEPLDLLRWAAASPSVLIRMLEDRFERLNDPEAITLFEHPQSGERMMRVECYGLQGHTHVPATVPDDVLLADLRRRLPWLARKLMADMAEGSRIFVTWPLGVGSGPWMTTEETAARILGLMEGFGGKPHLLFVRAGGDVRVQPGAIERLMLGWVSSFAIPGEPWSTIRSDDWLKLCRMAHAMVRGEYATHFARGQEDDSAPKQEALNISLDE